MRASVVVSFIIASVWMDERSSNGMKKLGKLESSSKGPAQREAEQLENMHLKKELMI
jgi:hypothetical protein